MEKYLVTGATGHLGYNVIDELSRYGEDVVALVKPGDSDVERLREEVEICYGDVRDKKSLPEFFDNPFKDDLIVVHCDEFASIKPGDKDLMHDINVTGTKNLIDESLKHKVKKFIYVSSACAINELPNQGIITEEDKYSSKKLRSLYAKSKAEATACALKAVKKGLDITVVQPSGIIGPYDYKKNYTTQMIIDYCSKALVIGVEGRYDFVDVRDVSCGIISAIEKGKRGESYILSNKYIEIKALFKLLSEVTKKNKIKTYLPKWSAEPEVPYSTVVLGNNSSLSHEKATSELGYETRDLEETVYNTIDFLKKEKLVRVIK
jgi:dihydroflavonol-4-reductase